MAAAARKARRLIEDAGLKLALQIALSLPVPLLGSLAIPFSRFGFVLRCSLSCGIQFADEKLSVGMTLFSSFESRLELIGVILRHSLIEPINIIATISLISFLKGIGGDYVYRRQHERSYERCPKQLRVRQVPSSHTDLSGGVISGFHHTPEREHSFGYVSADHPTIGIRTHVEDAPGH